MCGFDFHRQKPLDNFIVDFFCNELMLAIEIDGGSHCGKEDYDLYRQEKLESKGVCFLRFGNDEIINNIKSVLAEIEEWIKKNCPGESNSAAPGR